jgi:hypothetical protein
MMRQQDKYVRFPMILRNDFKLRNYGKQQAVQPKRMDGRNWFDEWMELVCDVLGTERERHVGVFAM